MKPHKLSSTARAEIRRDNRTILVLLVAIVAMLALTASVRSAEPAKVDPMVALAWTKPNKVDESVKSAWTASEPKATKTTISPTYDQIHAGHNCPNCGSQQFIQNRQQGNMHSHKCSSCGTEWWHSDGGVTTQSVQPLKSIGSFQSGGCVGGNCPTGSYSSGRDGWRPGKLLFGR